MLSKRVGEVSVLASRQILRRDVRKPGIRAGLYFV